MRTRITSAAVLGFLALGILSGCGRDHEHAADDHNGAGHDHGNAEEAPAVAVTKWTDEMELFMEYPLLAAGAPGRFIIQLTILDGFQPVREGRTVLRFESRGGETSEVAAEELLREGIFAPTVRIDEAGTYEFALSYEGPGRRDRFVLGEFVVYPNAGRFPAEEDEAPFEEIGFLKEQQWKIPFATAEAERREIKHTVRAIGEVLPSPNGYAEIVAPVDGIVRPGREGAMALPGSEVKRGDILAAIEAPVLGDGWASTRIAFQQAERNYQRAQRLRERDAISEREFETTRDAYLARKAGYENLAGGGEADALVLEAPMGGKVVDWRVSPGRHVSAGERLMSIVDPAVVWLKVHVYENDFRTLGTPGGATILAGGASNGWTVPEEDIRLLTTGGALDPATRTIPVLLEVRNGEGRLTIHETTPVEIHGERGEPAIAVPESAVYEDGGIVAVFVQRGGESFEKRQVVLGPRHAGYVSVTAGLRAGERVVATGGYHVKLASTSAEIGHGHAH